MSLSNNCKIELPDWVTGFVESWQQPLSTISQRMQLAIALSEENIQRKTGGPFAAIVVREETGDLVSIGINLVTSAGLSMAHAEIVALSLAQSAIGEWNLSHAGRLQLITSCEPCAMCFGAVPWSGVKSMICGARKKDAEKASREAVRKNLSSSYESRSPLLKQKVSHVRTSTLRTQVMELLGRS